MTIRSHWARWASILTVSVLAANLYCAPAARADDTDGTPGPLNIHVTAVQGGAQFRVSADTNKWQLVTGGLDLPEGVEFRTGPRGTVQFTVGTDQVFRVDRLTVVKVLRASLLPDGTINTDVGMTYGRVSKDVDQPAHPHRDTIVSPAATLAVRGTHVYSEDEPPFEPECGSLTGQANYEYYLAAYQVLFGKKGEGTAKIGAGNYDSSFFYMLGEYVLNPQGVYDGSTDAENSQLPWLDNLDHTPMAPFEHTNAIVAGQLLNRGAGNGSTMPGQLTFQLSWTSTGDNSLESVVHFSITSPLNEVVSDSSPGPVHSGGFYVNGSSIIADSSGDGTQTIQWSTSYATTGAKYPTGKYTVTETLAGTIDNNLIGDPSITASPTLTVTRTTPKGSFTLNSVPGTTLTAGTPSQSYTVTVPSLNVTRKH